MKVKETLENVISYIAKESKPHDPGTGFTGALKKGPMETALKEASTLDKIIAQTDKSDPVETCKNLKLAIGRLFSKLRPLIQNHTKKDELIGILNTAERKLSVGLKQTYLKYGVLEEENNTNTPNNTNNQNNEISSNEKKVDPEEAMTELEDFVKRRKQGAKAAEEFVVTCKLILEKVEIARKRGKGGLDINRQFATQIVISINKFSSEGVFFLGRNSLDKKFSEALKSGNCDQNLVSGLRKEAAVYFEQGMRSMATARSLSEQVLAETQEHELEVEKEEMSKGVSDQVILEYLNKILPSIEDAEKNKLLAKTEPPAWQPIEKYTLQAANEFKETKEINEQFEYSYQTKVSEATEAFAGVPQFAKLVGALLKRLTLVIGKSQTKEVILKIDEVKKRLTKMGGEVKQALLYKQKFEELLKKCNLVWDNLRGN